MSILKLMRDRQMYKYGQRVAKTLDGSRPGYRGEGGYGDGSEEGANSGGANSGGADDRSSAAQTASHNAAVSAAQDYNRTQNAKNKTIFGFEKPPNVFEKGFDFYQKYSPLGMTVRGITGLVDKFTGPRAVDYNDGYNMANISGPVSRDFGPEDGVGGDNIDSYVSTNQYPIIGNTEEEGIATLVNNPDFLQRFRVANEFRQDKQGQLDPAILEMISKLYT